MDHRAGLRACLTGGGSALLPGAGGNKQRDSQEVGPHLCSIKIDLGLRTKPACLPFLLEVRIDKTGY